MKNREPKDEHCVLQCTYRKDNIHNPIPLDNLKNHTALPYITWGLIWDSKKRKERIPNFNFHQTIIRDLKNRKGDLPIVKFITRQSSRIQKGRRRDFSEKAIKFKYQGWVEIWESSIRFIMSGMDKRSKIKKSRKYIMWQSKIRKL